MSLIVSVFYLIVFNPQAPVAQKIADEVVFRRFQSEGVEFFISDLTDPPSEFLIRIWTNEIEEKKTMFIHTNKP